MSSLHSAWSLLSRLIIPLSEAAGRASTNAPSWESRSPRCSGKVAASASLGNAIRCIPSPRVRTLYDGVCAMMCIVLPRDQNLDVIHLD